MQTVTVSRYKGFFSSGFTPPTRLRRPTSPFVLRKNGEGMHG
jgi:hypothetical protein